MKSNYRFMLVIIVMITVITGVAGQPVFKKENVTVILPRHKWVLGEFTRQHKDTIVDMKIYLDKCELDNLLEYELPGAYKISEHSVKCRETDNDVKGQGEWEYDEQSGTLKEKYAGGTFIPKTILELTDDFFRIRYNGEGGCTYTLTYLSEAGLANKKNKKLMVDQTDPCWSIQNLIVQFLDSVNHSILADDIIKDSEGNDGSRPRVLPRVAVMPFINMTETNAAAGMNKRNDSLMAAAKAAGVDFVITGALKKAETKENKDGNVSGKVRYGITVLNIAKNDILSRDFDSPEPGDNQPAARRGGFGNRLRGVTNRLPDVPVFIPAPYWGDLSLNNKIPLWNKVLWESVLLYQFSRNSGFLGLEGTQQVLGTVDNEDRKNRFNKKSAIMDAINRSAGETFEFVSDNLAVKIPIASIDDSRGKTLVMLAAGNNINLRPEEQLQVVRVSKDAATGKETIKIIGEIKVSGLSNTSNDSAGCIIVEDKKQILAAYAADPASVMAMTMFKAKDNKKDK